MSWRVISNLLFLKTIPVKPPKVKSKRNPKVHSKHGERVKVDPTIVANHLNTLIPVGIPITMLTMREICSCI